MTSPTLKKITSPLTKFFVIILLISSVLSALYVASSIHVKNNIRHNLAPVIADLQQDSGAESIDVKICAEPDSYGLPWFSEFHVFLTANIHDLRRVTESKALEILNNGVELGQTEYSYDWDLFDYALYNRTVTDTVTGIQHPVFVTLTDGSIHYSVEENSLYDINMLRKADTYKTLHPPFISNIMMIILLITIALWAIGTSVVYKKHKKRLEQKQADKEKALAEKQNDLTVGIENVLRNIDDEILSERKTRTFAKKKKVVIVTVCSILGIAIAGASVTALYVIPNSKYTSALSLRDAGKTDEAYTIFKELDGFKDSRDICDEIDYMKAVSHIDNEEYKDAYMLLSKSSRHEDCMILKQQLEQTHPYLSILSSKPGDIVVLGEYEQDNDTENGKEPIEWIVLSNDDGDVYLLSKYVLDAQPFNTANRKECTLDDWLKTTFSQNAFESVDGNILTRVGILQEIDIENYGLTTEQRTAEYTPYALSQDPEYWSYDGGYLWWLIEEDLFNGGGDISAPVVLQDGRYGAYSCDVIERGGVRPAVWLFADPDSIPAEPVFDNSAPTQWRPSSGGSGSGGSGSKCSSCNGTGKKLVTWYSEGDWGEKTYTSYSCTACGGDGRK